MLIHWSAIINSATPWYCYPLVFALYIIAHVMAFVICAWGFAVCFLVVGAPVVYGGEWLRKRLK